MKYPLAPAGTRYEETTIDPTWMTPDEFLSRVRPLTIDSSSIDCIDALKEHILSGLNLDPLCIYADGREDGRHRAYAAKQLNIKLVPVIIHRETTMSHTITFTKIKHDSNGNPRYVCHFLALMTKEELAKTGDEWIPIDKKYEIALKRAKQFGGRKYHTKAYGGGIVFQSYNLNEELSEINRLTGQGYTGYEVD